VNGPPLGCHANPSPAQVVLPSAPPTSYRFRVGAGFAFRGLIFAEIIAAKSGIGYLIFEGGIEPPDRSNHRRHITQGLSVAVRRQCVPEAISMRVTIERWGQVTTRSSAGMTGPRSRQHPGSGRVSPRPALR